LTTPALQTLSDLSERSLWVSEQQLLPTSGVGFLLLVHVSLMLLGSGTIVWTFSMSSDMKSSGPLLLPCFSFLWLSFQPTSIPSFVFLGSVARDNSLYIQTLCTLAEQTMCIHFTSTITQKHSLSTKNSTRHSHQLQATPAHRQRLLAHLQHQC